MYDLNINFLKERQFEDISGDVSFAKKTTPPISTQTPVLIGLAVLVILPTLAGISVWLLNARKATIEKEIAAIDTEIARLQSKNEEIQQLQEQLKTVNNDNKNLVSIFNQIKPWSAMLQDIRDLIPPGVEIRSIQQQPVEAKDKSASNQQPRVKVTINGIAQNFDSVNDFLLALQSSKFFDPQKTIIENAELTSNPDKIVFSEPIAENISVTLPEVVNYTIETELSNTPADKILPILTQQGAVGLVARIRMLEQKGAIKP